MASGRLDLHWPSDAALLVNDLPFVDGQREMRAQLIFATAVVR